MSGTVVLPPSDVPCGTLEFLLRTDVVGLHIEVLDPPSCRGPADIRPGERGDQGRIRWAAGNALTAERSSGQETAISRAARDLLRELAE